MVAVCVVRLSFQRRMPSCRFRFCSRWCLVMSVMAVCLRALPSAWSSLRTECWSSAAEWRSTSSSHCLLLSHTYAVSQKWPPFYFWTTLSKINWFQWYLVREMLFGFSKVKWLQITGEVSKSVSCWCNIFSGSNVLKSLKWLIFDRVIEKLKRWPFFETQCITSSVCVESQLSPYSTMWLFHSSQPFSS